MCIVELQKVPQTLHELILCVHSCDLFQDLLLGEGLNDESTSHVLDTGIQEVSQVHKSHPVEGGLWILFGHLQPQAHRHTCTCT